MWRLIEAECRYQKGRALGFLAGAVGVATVFGTMNDMNHAGEYFMFPSLLLSAGILVHITTLWDADMEKRETLHAQLPLSPWRAAGGKLLAPLVYQEIGFGAAVVLWVALVAGGVVAEDVGTEALGFLIAANGAALAFVIGWAHLAPEVDGAKQRYPWLAWTVVGVSVAIVLGTIAWTFAPSLIDSPLAISYPVAAAIFYPLATAIAALKLWLYTRRDERTL